MHAIVAVAIFLAIPFTLTSLQLHQADPTTTPTTLQKNFSDIARAAVKSYHEKKIDHQSRMNSSYHHYSDYVDYGTTKQYRDSSRVRLDPTGLPQVLYGTTYHYNPVTLAQYALTMHGRYTKATKTPWIAPKMHLANF